MYWLGIDLGTSGIKAVVYHPKTGICRAEPGDLVGSLRQGNSNGCA